MRIKYSRPRQGTAHSRWDRRNSALPQYKLARATGSGRKVMDVLARSAQAAGGATPRF